jgi:hypothetical protein
VSGSAQSAYRCAASEVENDRIAAEKNSCRWYARVELPDTFMKACAGLHGNVAVEVNNLFFFSASRRLCHYSTYARGRR